MDPKTPNQPKFKTISKLRSTISRNDEGKECAMKLPSLNRVR
jgi:hypothetical protein